MTFLSTLEYTFLGTLTHGTDQFRWGRSATGAERGKLGLTVTHAPNLAYKSSFWQNIGAKDILRGGAQKSQECRWQDQRPGQLLSQNGMDVQDSSVN